MKKLFTITTFLLLLISLRPAQAQTDTEFWFAVPKVTEGHSWGGRNFYFRFANLNLPNHIVISMPSNPAFVPIEATLAPNEARTIQVTDLIFDLWTESPNEIYDRGIKITATNLTTAYFEVGTINNPDIYALKGRNALGKDFYVPFQDHFDNGIYNPKPYSGIYIVATQDETTVTVLPTNDVFPGRPAGVAFDTILNMGQTIAIVPDDYNGAGMQADKRLGGTRVTADKPIAISTSDDSVSANPYGGCRDLIGDQLVPTSIIGTEYIAMRGRLGQGGWGTMPEFFYVLGTQPDTQVFIDGNLEAIIQPGEQLRWQFNQQNHHIKTSDPAYVYHVAGFGCEMGGAVLPPINVCTGSTKVSFTRSKGESFFLNIMVRAGAEDGFIFNGDGPNTVVKASDFVTVPGTTDWLAAEYEMDETMVPVGMASLIENVKDVFHLGIINGGPSSGTMYGYFSDFNELNISALISGAGGAFHRACFGESVQLVAQGGVNYQWHPVDFLDDPTSATPIALPDTSIKYTVTVSGACKMIDSTSVQITLYGPAEAAFTIDEPSGCSPFDLTVFNESFGISNYSWRMGDGTVYTTGAEEFNHIYTNTTDEPLVRELMLVGRYSMCRDTMLTHVTVYPEVVAEAQADIINGCAPLTVNFENYSQRADHYHWKFGDGASSSNKEPQHVFQNFTNQEITYDVELLAFSKNGCASDTTIQITVKPYIEAGFTFDPPVHCSPYPVTLSNTSFGATSNWWSFDGGNTMESNELPQFIQTFENNGEYPEDFEIWLIGENDFGCIDTLIKPLTVFPAVKSAFSTDVIEGCNPLLVEFTNESEGAGTYQWDFDLNAGTSSQINPQVLFTNPSLQDTAVFNVKLTATSDDLCQDVYEKQIRVFPRIEANFTFDYTSFCTPQQVTFSNNSLGASQYYWDFGDGNTSQSSAASVEHSFMNETDTDIIYPVTLIIENENGCTDTIVRNVTIFPQISADFNTTTSGCHPLEVEFENASAGAANYYWDFGDGGSSQEITPSRIYTNTSHLENKTYTISLIAESVYGCRDTLERTITVYPKPLASYTISENTGCAPLYADFTTNSTGATSFLWNFGDDSNEVSSTGSVAHTYYNNNETTTIFTSRMIAENQFGCSDTLFKSIEVFPEVKAGVQVSEPSGCHPLELQIINTSEGASATTPFYWVYGDGNQSSSEEPTQTYTYQNFSHTESETFTIRLRAESLYGCKDSTETIVTVHPRPSAVFQPLTTEGCSPLEVAFADASIGAGSYNWYFGDGATSDQTGNVNHTFHQPHDMGPGLFPIGLLIENQFGCTDSTYNQVMVYPEITAAFEAITEGCHPLLVDFTNLSVGVNTLNWSFGDGSTSGHEHPQYVYTNESFTENQYYDVLLHTSSVYGCEAQTSQQITVHPKPKSAFNVNLFEGCSPLLVEIENLSEGGSYYEWNLGGYPGNQQDTLFEHTLSNLQETPQTMLLELLTTNEYGCFRESFQHVEVYPEVWADFGADNEAMEGCNPLPLEFINYSERAHKYSWDFDDGNTSTLTQPFNEFFTPGTQESIYDIKLTAESVYGCLDSIVRQAKVFPVPNADFFVSPYAQMYPSKTIRLDNLSAPGNWDFTWNMGDGNILSTDNWETIDHEYIWPAGDYSTRQYTVSLMAANNYCNDSIAQTVVVHAPYPMVGFEPSAQGCPPLNVQFRNDSKYGLEFFWDFDDGHSSDLENPMHTFHEPGEYMVKLLVSGEGGIDSAYQQVTVFELPRADFRVSTSEVQLPYESVKMINLSSLASYFEWDMGDGTYYYEFEPEHQYQEPGVYDIKLSVATNTFPQCYDVITKSNAVNAEQTCQIIFPDAFTPNTSGSSDGRYIANDPANHVFYPVHIGVKDYQLDIFNRWGEFLFRSTDVNIGWDGYYRGKLSSMDVYVWKVKATCHSGKKIEAAGDVTLYR